METKDILENQPWSLIEDQLTDDIEILDDDDDKVIDKSQEKEHSKPAPEKPTGNPFKLLAEDLGLNLEDDWDGDADDLKQLVLNNAKEDLLSSFNDPVVTGFIEFISNGGAPNDFIQAMQAPAVDRMSSEEVYMTYMRMTTNFNEDKIKRLMEKSKDLDDFESEVDEYREEIKEAQSEQIQTILKEQEETKKQKAIVQKQAQEYRKKLVRSKEIMGLPISKNAEFERFYLKPTEKITYGGKDYLVTAYQKRLIERQKDPVQYEALMAYLEFTDFKGAIDETKIKNKAVSGLKEKLSNYYGSSTGAVTRLIDES
jgi:hypothetical protein